MTIQVNLHVAAVIHEVCPTLWILDQVRDDGEG